MRPALHAKKLRDLELRSGEPARRGQRGAAYAYNLTRTRQEERRPVEQAETAYRRMTEGWSRRGRRAPQRRSDLEDSAVGLSPHARLFVTRSPVGGNKIAQMRKKGLFNLIRCPGVIGFGQPVRDAVLAADPVEDVP